MDKEMISVIDENGNTKEAEVVLCFENNGKNFIIYTFNEMDSNGMIILYSSMIRQENGENVFEKIGKDDWNTVKEVMNSIAKDWKEQ